MPTEPTDPGQGIMPDGLIWSRSSHSGGGNDCVEVAFQTGHALLRDSKDPSSGMLVTGRAGWRGVLTALGAPVRE